MTDKMSLQVELRDQHGVVFSGMVSSLSSSNSQGNFDILPQHAHFISLIQGEVIVQPLQGQTQRFNISRGVLRCFDNKVEIFTGLDSQVTTESSLK